VRVRVCLREKGIVHVCVCTCDGDVKQFFILAEALSLLVYLNVIVWKPKEYG